MIEEHLTQPETYFGPYTCERCEEEYEYASEDGLCGECEFTLEMKRRAANATNELARKDYYRYKAKRAIKKLVAEHAYNLTNHI